MINLRRMFWKENLYSANYRWGSDVALNTSILAIWNPISNSKKINLVGIDIGAYDSAVVRLISTLYQFTGIAGATDLSSIIIKYSPSIPSSIAKIYGGGTLTLGQVFKRVTLDFGVGFPFYSFKLDQEIELLPGNGIAVIHEAESVATVYNPYCTFTWFE